MYSIAGPGETPEAALEAGMRVGASRREVTVGMSSAAGCLAVKEAFSAGLMAAGCRVRDAGANALPAVAAAGTGSDLVAYVRGEAAIEISLMAPDGSAARDAGAQRGGRGLPGYRGVGSARRLRSVSESYAERAARALPSGGAGSLVILDCGRGGASECAPRLLALAGAEASTIDAHGPCPGAGGDPPEARLSAVSALAGGDSGSIGIAIDDEGSRLALVDEGGSAVDPECMVALALLYLRPSRAVVPIDASAVVDDAFHGIIGEGVRTSARFGADRRLIRSDGTLAGTVGAMAEGEADFGALRDGTMVFPSMSLCPDAVFGAAVLAKMSAENSLRNLLGTFPRYSVLSESVRLQGGREPFSRRLSERLASIEGADVRHAGGWRANMDGGWFSVSIAEDGSAARISAESRDRVYAAGMMDVAREAVLDCV
ncbi:MAG: hypothetical protein LBG62_00460 [Candidatus Methanoplasma sp.]|jgi:phosphoglucosamine mutase|nr:hypothetical protein [Candidatus Methanoplasma sp.]